MSYQVYETCQSFYKFCMKWRLVWDPVFFFLDNLHKNACDCHKNIMACTGILCSQIYLFFIYMYFLRDTLWIKNCLRRYTASENLFSQCFFWLHIREDSLMMWLVLVLVMHVTVNLHGFLLYILTTWSCYL